MRQKINVQLNRKEPLIVYFIVIGRRFARQTIFIDIFMKYSKVFDCCFWTCIDVGQARNERTIISKVP